MATVNRFEDLMSWKKARDLANNIHQKSSELPFSKDFALVSQINRASGSVMDNIAEGFGRGSRKEFIQFLVVAKGSCNEVQSQLYRALDRNYVSETEFEQLYDEADHTCRMIANFIEYLKKTEHDGIRYKHLQR